jgi:hypothetical protein
MRSFQAKKTTDKTQYRVKFQAVPSRQDYKPSENAEYKSGYINHDEPSIGFSMVTLALLFDMEE